MTGQEEVSEEKPKLSPTTQSRNVIAAIAFDLFRSELARVYELLNGSLEWTHSGWHKFVNSKELGEVIDEVLAFYELDEVRQKALASCDPKGEWEEVALPGGISVLCLPDIGNITADKPVAYELARLQLMKSMMHFFLKKVLIPEFYVVGSVKPFRGKWLVTDDLHYEYIPDPRF